MSKNPPARWPAPAKLNLFLHITGRRKDGYHELQTLYQLIDWCDELSFDIDPTGSVSRVAPGFDVPEDEDLAVRAARLLQQRAGVSAGATIRMDKRIPLGAGLGGGSSDAATTLLVLNRLWRAGLDEDALAELGLQLGADVPVFVRGRSAIGEGVGERLEPVTLGERYYVVVLSSASVSTRDAFSNPALERRMPRIGLEAALSGEGRNAFEPVVAGTHPEIAQVLHELRSLGTPRLTGTGSAIFLELPDEDTARRTAQELKCRYNVRAVRGIDRSPVHEMLPSP